MLKRLFASVVIGPNDVSPSHEDLDVVGTFNPGATSNGEETILLVRVAERPRERRRGLVGLPRWDANAGLVIDWGPEDRYRFVDPRVVEDKQTGLVRLTFHSHLRAFRSRDGKGFEPLGTSRFEPCQAWEEYGVEDPRITKIGDRFYITYVAASRHGVSTALASTDDFLTFERHGVIFCTENKDVVLFPERIDGQYVALHRPNGSTPFTNPSIWIARSPDLIHWGRHDALVQGDQGWEGERIGAGVPPIRVDGGWLEIYHGSQRNAASAAVGTYSAGALLLDAQHPDQIVRRSSDPLLIPELDFETKGFVPNVVFPTGMVERGDEFWIYYGAADTVSAVVGLSRADLLGALQA